MAVSKPKGNGKKTAGEKRVDKDKGEPLLGTGKTRDAADAIQTRQERRRKLRKKLNR